MLVTSAPKVLSKTIIVKIVIVFFYIALESDGAWATQWPWQSELYTNGCQINLSIFGTNLHDFVVISYLSHPFH